MHDERNFLLVETFRCTVRSTLFEKMFDELKNLLHLLVCSIDPRQSLSYQRVDPLAKVALLNETVENVLLFGVEILMIRQLSFENSKINRLEILFVTRRINVEELIFQLISLLLVKLSFRFETFGQFAKRRFRLANRRSASPLPQIVDRRRIEIFFQLRTKLNLRFQRVELDIGQGRFNFETN